MVEEKVNGMRWLCVGLGSGRIAEITAETKVCHIGLKQFACVPAFFPLKPYPSLLLFSLSRSLHSLLLLVFHSLVLPPILSPLPSCQLLSSSLALLIYDLFLNVFLTSLFVWPIFRSNFLNPKIRAVAIRTMLSAGAALTTSTINILVLTLMHGKQLGWGSSILPFARLCL
jgi:hypothetical protein